MYSTSIGNRVEWGYLYTALKILLDLVPSVNPRLSSDQASGSLRDLVDSSLRRTSIPCLPQTY
jgi:hypothetical protein